MQLKGKLDIGQSGQLKAALMDSLKRVDNVKVLVDKDTEVDLPIIQLLCAAHRTAQLQGKRMTLAYEQSEAFCGSVQCAGYLRHAGCDHDHDDTCFWKEGESQ